MVFGGSLNKEVSDYIRKVREADKVLKFLEEFKKELNKTEKDIVSKTIDIIVDYVNNLTEGK